MQGIDESDNIIELPIKREIPKAADVEPIKANEIDYTLIDGFDKATMLSLKQIKDNSVDLVLYDPPYSQRQVSESYRKLDMTVNMETTQNSYWTKQKREIARIVKQGGYVISCAWNSGGIGKKYGFEIQEILLVAHGSWHNDTITTVERKVK